MEHNSFKKIQEQERFKIILNNVDLYYFDLETEFEGKIFHIDAKSKPFKFFINHKQVSHDLKLLKIVSNEYLILQSGTEENLNLKLIAIYDLTLKKLTRSFNKVNISKDRIFFTEYPELWYSYDSSGHKCLDFYKPSGAMDLYKYFCFDTNTAELSINFSTSYSNGNDLFFEYDFDQPVVKDNYNYLKSKLQSNKKLIVKNIASIKTDILTFGKEDFKSTIDKLFFESNQVRKPSNLNRNNNSGCVLTAVVITTIVLLFQFIN